jgi:hypothetical protein
VENSAHLVSLGARVEPDLAAAVRRLADAGDRSVSREIRRAIVEHVERRSAGLFSPPPSAPPAAEGA